ncbi:MAG: glycosyltransferase family 39 protein [Chloroflexota bacterium]
MRSASLTPVARWDPWLILLLALGSVLRLVNLDAPPLDFHPTRQLRNALVARSIYYDADTHADPQKRALALSFRRAVGQYEPPILETIVGQTFLFAGGESFAVPRIYGTLFWLLGGLALFDTGRRIASPASARIALTYYLVLPFGVQASRSFQPDPLMTASFVIGINFLYRWSEDLRWKWALLGAAFAGFAVLVKIVIVFLVVGAATAIVITTLGRRFWKSAQVWAMIAVMMVPAAVYYLLGHVARSTEFLFAWTVDLFRLTSSPHFYADWLGFVGGLVGLTILFLGLAGTALAGGKSRWLLIGLWTGYLLYGLTLPFQMFTHSYYHLQLVPVIAIGLLPVAEAVIARAQGVSRVWRAAALVPLLLLTGYQAWAARSALVAEDFGAAPRLWETIGEAIPEDADVIALTQDYGFDLMYWGWHKVRLWPLNTALSQFRAGDRELAVRFAELTAGNDYFLVTAFGQLESQPALAAALDGYSVADEGDGYILYDLSAPK